MTTSKITAPWVFSRRVDLLAFALPAALALALVVLLPVQHDPEDSPEWVWITGVLLVDVAHVWSTLFITYLNPAELRRHADRYWLVPAASWVLGALFYGLGGAQLFWRALAYVAVFHFVRQQYGWMALYRARAGERTRVGAAIDAAAIYAATLYPLIWWHTRLPRHFNWFLPGDFAPGLPQLAATLAAGLYVACLLVYLARALLQLVRAEPIPWGKHLLLLATATTWYVGIVARNDDLAFTLTNVLAHGVPYAFLVFSYARHTAPAEPGLASRALGGSAAMAVVRFLACIWLFAFIEELLWDRGMWHEHESLFGSSLGLGSLEPWLVPLLAVPQLTHYIVDGMFWRRASNPHLRSWFQRKSELPR